MSNVDRIIEMIEKKYDYIEILDEESFNSYEFGNENSNVLYVHKDQDDIYYILTSDSLSSFNDFEDLQFNLEGYYGLEIRQCTHCRELMVEGWYLNDEYACSKECVIETMGSWDNYLKEAQEDEFRYYWTEWS